jgi:hypothetical protein
MITPSTKAARGTHDEPIAEAEIVRRGLVEKRRWQEIGAACSEHSCTKVLSEGVMAKRRLTITDAFQSGLAAAKEIPGLQLALCLDDYEADDVTAFFQSVASNRGVRFEVFSSIEEAIIVIALLAWGGNRPPAPTVTPTASATA